jgi:hypothetical protein
MKITINTNTNSLALALTYLIIPLFFISCSKNDNRLECTFKSNMSVFEFTMIYNSQELNFYAATSDTKIVNIVMIELEKPIDERSKFINGIVKSGNGCYNKDFNWHFAPNQWELVEASIELCDGYPGNPEHSGLERSCPWSSRILRKIN